ncbi:MAG: hypothetical protein AAGD11_20150 [Planctomycetota bacterium]
MRLGLLATLLAVMLLFVAGHDYACGGISSVGGNVEVVSAPPSVRNDAFESDTAIRVFLESEVFVSAVEVNAVAYGLYDEYGDFDDQLLMPRGGVRSYLVHHDQVGNAESLLSGSITFDVPILAIIGRSSTLENTDATLGANGTLYATVREGRQIDYQNDTDQFIWQRNRRTIEIQSRVTSKFDQLRILTAVPEPGGLGLLMAASLLCFGSRQLKFASL